MVLRREFEHPFLTPQTSFSSQLKPSDLIPSMQERGIFGGFGRFREIPLDNSDSLQRYLERNGFQTELTTAKDGVNVAWAGNAVVCMDSRPKVSIEYPDKGVWTVSEAYTFADLEPVFIVPGGFHGMVALTAKERSLDTVTLRTYEDVADWMWLNKYKPTIRGDEDAGLLGCGFFKAWGNGEFGQYLPPLAQGLDPKEIAALVLGYDGQVITLSSHYETGHAEPKLTISLVRGWVPILLGNNYRFAARDTGPVNPQAAFNLTLKTAKLLGVQKVQLLV